MTVPWAKAGIIIKESTQQGSAYAAMMVTGGHGVRMQHDFTGDTAGSASDRWLRLARTGDILTGYESGDGTNWEAVGTATLSGLPSTVRIGLFVSLPAAHGGRRRRPRRLQGDRRADPRDGHLRPRQPGRARRRAPP